MTDAGTLSITAFSRDSNNWDWRPRNAKTEIEVVDCDYTPSIRFLSDGETIRFEVDIATGQIKNWDANVVLDTLNRLAKKKRQDENDNEDDEDDDDY